MTKLTHMTTFKLSYDADYGMRRNRTTYIMYINTYSKPSKRESIKIMFPDDYKSKQLEAVKIQEIVFNQLETIELGYQY